MLTKTALKKTDSRRREWFKYQLRDRRSSFAAIARDLGISRPAVSRGILSPSERLATAVALALGKEKSELWPRRFGKQRSGL